MTHWLYEDGIGEERAALIEHGRIVEARIQRSDQTGGCGAIVAGRLLAKSAGGHRARILLSDGSEAMLQPVPKDLSEGKTVRAEVVREALVEPGLSPATTRHKPARLRAVAADTPLREAPSLLDRITADGHDIIRVSAHGPDVLAESGWHDVLAEAETGQIAFTGGSLTLSPTPAMTVIDVDGDIAPRALGLAAATQIAHAIRRHGIGGSVVVDFPTLADKADRNAVANYYDAAMPLPCERTAINGYGLMQIVLKRTRASLMELFAADPVRWHVMAALRSAERDGGTGVLALDLSAAESQLLAREPAWLDALQRRTGRAVAVQPATA
ncbi:ribonuclease E/G [Blastomonas sp. AAP53]|uniref:ribonuclease E/G n=1 Tax=Blastomonas sp. AAP53 TaxID=1248760 RepID=UPI000360CA2B|nr:ribonuclease E/G [Blastomonas sp. AAP53]